MKTIRSKLSELYHRFIYEGARPGFRRKVLAEIPEASFGSHAARLLQEGILILPRYFQGEFLRELQEDFERMVGEQQCDRRGAVTLERSWLAKSRAFSRVAVDPYLVSLAAYYWGKPVVLAETAGLRFEPAESSEVNEIPWHHDGKRKQVKVMVLLTAVLPDGQRMDYYPGTQRLWHQSAIENLNFSSADLHQKYGEPLRCAGPAGTVVVFDTNGIHRGNRNRTTRRDVWIYNFTAGRHLYEVGGIHPDIFSSISPQAKQMVSV